jgi:O-methyltransferase
VTPAGRVLRDLGRALVKRDDSARHELLVSAAALLLPHYKLPELGRSYLRDDDFLRWFDPPGGCGHFGSLDRRYALDQLAKLVCDVPGDTAECGVFAGKGSELICRRTARPGRVHHAFDSWQGLPAPEPVDGPLWHEGDLRIERDHAEERLREHAVAFWPGFIPDRFAEVGDRAFALVHVDVALHRPTADSLAFFWPRLSERGLLICDDYGNDACPGVRRAVDDFFADGATPIAALPTGQALVVK